MCSLAFCTMFAYIVAHSPHPNDRYGEVASESLPAKLTFIWMVGWCRKALGELQCDCIPQKVIRLWQMKKYGTLFSLKVKATQKFLSKRPFSVKYNYSIKHIIKCKV